MTIKIMVILVALLIISACSKSVEQSREDHYQACIENPNKSKKFTDEICRCMSDKLYSELTPDQIYSVKTSIDKKSNPHFNTAVDALKFCVSNKPLL